MLAETAQLAVQLNLGGNFTQGLSQAEARLAGFNATAAGSTARTSVLSSAFGGVRTAAVGVGGALSHAGGQIRGLLTGPLGMLGLAGGLFTLGGAIDQGIHRAVAFGDEVRRLSALTGQSSEATSAMAAAMEHFGIGADTAIRLTGFLEKNVGLLAARKNGIADFEKTFSFGLRDANGHLKDANELLLTSADYFNTKSIPATEKAAAMAKLYGRSWQELIPFLKAGRQGIADAEAEAKSLGLTLSKDNVDALSRLKTATRDWSTALGGLELQVGLQLVPLLTKMATAATGFVRTNGPQITRFFGDLATFAESAAGTIGSFAGAIASFWGALPKPFRDILVTGIVADRSFKFLFGFDPIKLITSPLTAGLGALFGRYASRGSSPANPLYVTGTGLGGTGTGGGGLGIIGALGVAALIDTLATEIVGPAVRDWAVAHNLAGSGSNAGKTDSQLAYERMHPPASGGGPSVVGIKGIVGVVDKSPGARDERQAALTAARKSAAANATTAAHTEGLRSGISTLQQRLVAKQETANARLARIAAKRETNRINVVNQINIRIPITAGEAGSTVSRVVSRSGTTATMVAK